MIVIAHRGASGHAPENTMAAFVRALELRARAIELDVHQTLDHELVVAHDDDLRRCGRDRRRLKALHWDDAAQVEVGSWFEGQGLTQINGEESKGVRGHKAVRRGDLELAR